MKVTFSVNRYDQDGDLLEKGIFLHFGNVIVKVAETDIEFWRLINDLRDIRKEISENYKF